MAAAISYKPAVAGDPSKIEWDVSDRRTLLYWNPTIITNIKGQSKMTFLKGDITEKMLIFCKGITSNGNVGYSEVFYEVNNP